MEDGILVPISSRHTVQDGVYQQLRTALMAGQYDPGQRLTIGLLATAFGVSHMPVREALRKLVAENALEQGANGSVSVPNVRQDRLDDICRARIALEGLAAELAAPLITDTGIRTLDRLRISHKDAGIEDGAYESLARNQEFHFFIYRASGSEVLPQLIEALWLRFGPYMRMLSHHLVQSVGPAGFRNGAEFHANAIKALERRDASAFRFCVEADIRATHAMLRPLVPMLDGTLEVTPEPVAG
jgi:DNA-binding GntR family transcriptional regulator